MWIPYSDDIKVFEKLDIKAEAAVQIVESYSEALNSNILKGTIFLYKVRFISFFLHKTSQDIIPYMVRL